MIDNDHYRFRQFAKIIIAGLTTFRHWLMERPYGACLIIIFARNFLVLAQRRFYHYYLSIVAYFTSTYYFSFMYSYFYYLFQDSCRSTGEESIVLVTDYPDAVHNFLLSQRLTTLLGNFPEVK